MKDTWRPGPFRDAHKDASECGIIPDTPQTRAPSYRLAYADTDFLCRDELRPVRLQLELLKPEIVMKEKGIHSTVILFGGARILEPSKVTQETPPQLADLSKYYDQAREFARRVTLYSMETYGRDYVIATGGGPGVMEAGNRGAADAGGISIGLNIVLPHEQMPNAYITPGLSFNFHYFAIRKMHFLLRAKALAVFPGGFGTMDELFEALTLIQTKRMQPIPILLFGKKFWKEIINWDALVDAGTIAAEDLDLFHFVETADQALEILQQAAKEDSSYEE